MMKPYYQDDAVTIYHGDCREIVPQLGRFDLLLTDPPYGIKHESSHVADTTTAAWMRSRIYGDDDTSLRDCALAWNAEWCVFASIKAPPPVGWRGCMVWDKGEAAGMGDLSFPWKPNWELIFAAGNHWTGRRDTGVLRGPTMVTRASMGRKHPHEKPVWLIAQILAKHTAEIVLDPFAGSGTTGRAAKDLGRKATLIEREERYCEIAASRMAQEVLPLDYRDNTEGQTRGGSRVV